MVWAWVLLAVLILVLTAWYLTYTAARLDRLHSRVEGSLAALDAQLVRRAETSLELGNTSSLDAASALLLASSAANALNEAESALITDDVQAQGISPSRSLAESELTDALDATLSEFSPTTEADVELRRRLVDACERVEVARSFHNEAIADVRRVRAKPSVKLFRLAGHTALPEPADFDSALTSLQ